MPNWQRLTAMPGCGAWRTFHRWHALAREHGFIRMWRSWQLEAGVAERLLALPDGERLHDESAAPLRSAGGTGPRRAAWHRGAGQVIWPMRATTRAARPIAGKGGCCVWRATRIWSASSPFIPSKGLEYPVTYCPFLWDGKLREADGPVRYHDPACKVTAPPWILVRLQFDGARIAPWRHRGNPRRSALRLAYVALTRARQHCVLVWGALSRCRSPRRWPGCCTASEQRRFRSRTAMTDLRARVARLACRLRGYCRCVICRQPRSRSRGRATRRGQSHRRSSALPWPRTFSMPPWRMHSFSAWLLNAGGSRCRSTSFRSTTPLRRCRWIPCANAEIEVSKFPAGANAGTCLHAMFERADFVNPETEIIARPPWPNLVSRQVCSPSPCNLFGDVLATPMT